MVGQYISIEKAIADSKESYYDVLQQADQRWQEGENDPKPFIRYMLAIILSCYRELESRMRLSGQIGKKSTAYDIVNVCTGDTGEVLQAGCAGGMPGARQLVCGVCT